MNHQKPISDPEERIFTLSDLKRLVLSQKKKIFKASCLGAVLGFGIVLFAFSPKYQIHATFKEASNVSGTGVGSLDKLLGNFVSGGSLESQTVALIQSHQVMRPLVERMGIQATVRQGGFLSKVYRRIRDNLLSERAKALSDIDWFAFRDVVYDGEKELSYSLKFEDPRHFSVLSGKGIAASGTLGSPVHLPEAKLTIFKAPKKLRVGSSYPMVIQSWISSLQGVHSKFQISPVKTQKSIYQLSYSHRDRHFGKDLLNTLMDEYRKYLQRDHDQVVQEQLAYLQKKQEEIYGSMSAVFDEYSGYLRTNLTQSGQLGLTQEIAGLTKQSNGFANKIFAIDLELDLLQRMELDQKAFVTVDETAFARSAKNTLEAISNLQQQRDLIALSMPSSNRGFNELEYENRKGELKEVRDRLSAMQCLLEGINRGAPASQDALFDAEKSLEAWAARLSDSQEEERKDLAGYLENYVRLLSMQEKLLQEQIHYSREIPPTFKGIDLTTAGALFVEYCHKFDRAAEAMGNFSRLRDEIAESDFEISSLSAVLSDPLSQRLIEQASQIALKLKDEKHRSEKEGDRWMEELSLQKKILQDHLDQLYKVERMRSSMICDNIDALQSIKLGCISGQISVLQERLADSVKERRNGLLKEKTILEERMKLALKRFTCLPDRWRKEKWLNLKTQMGIKMVQTLTEIVESKTISSHLHHVDSKPLDIATLPAIPCSPGLLLKAFLGAFLAGSAVLFGSFFRTVLKGFPSSREKLRAMGYPVLGEISSLCDGPEAELLGGPDLETLRQIFLFLDKSPKEAALATASKGKSVCIIEGKGPDCSFALAQHFARMSLSSLVLRCDFNVRFTPRDLPGLLQFWKKEIPEPPIERRQGYDYLRTGGYTPYGAEIVRSVAFKELLGKFKNEYDFVLVVFRSPLHSVESMAPLSLCDQAIVIVSGEPTEQLTPFLDWAYHENMCRLAFLTASSP